MRRALHGAFSQIVSEYRTVFFNYMSQDTTAPDGEGSDPSTPALSTPTPDNTKHHKRLELTELTDQTNLLPFRKVLTVFLGLSVCIVVSTLDQTLVATALPSIATAFHAGMSHVVL